MGKSKVGRSAVARYLRINQGFKLVKMSEPTLYLFRLMYKWSTYTKVHWSKYMKMYDAIYKTDSTALVGYALRKSQETWRNVVIDDVRYMNEVEILKNAGFTVVRITAPEERRKRIAALFDPAPGNLIVHEWFNKDFTEQIGVDYSIHNDTKLEMKKSVDALLEKIGFVRPPRQISTGRIYRGRTRDEILEHYGKLPTYTP